MNYNYFQHDNISINMYLMALKCWQPTAVKLDGRATQWREIMSTGNQTNYNGQRNHGLYKIIIYHYIAGPA